MTTITMLGAGIMASALSVPLADNGHEVRLVGTFLDREIVDSIAGTGVHPGLDRRLPDAVRAYQLEGLADAVADAEIVLSGVNSFGVRWAGGQLASVLTPDKLVVAIAKGVDAADNGDLRVLTEVLAEPVPQQVRDVIPWSGIVGPSIAGEVFERRDTCVVFAGPDQGALDRLADVFRTDRYHVWTSSDLIGAEVAAAMKNCYALGVGLAEGVLQALGESENRYRNHNFEAALFAQGSIEMRQMIGIVGGEADTAARALPTVGDMYVTSAGGRNVRVGRLMGTGMPFSTAREELGNPTLEGAAAIEVIGGALGTLCERGVIGPEDFPLLRHLYEVVALERPLRIPWGAFFGGER